MIDPSKACLFIPNGLTKFKIVLFNRIGAKILAAGGRIVRGNYAELDALPDDIIPIVGCSPELKPLIDRWRARGRDRIQWDRGYARRIFATWLPRGADGGYYRWHLNSFQMQRIRDVPGDRWAQLLPGNTADHRKISVWPWKRYGNHIVVAEPSQIYSASHGIEGWTEKTVKQLKLLTKRRIIVREKLCDRPLQMDLLNAHCLVAHGTIAAVEAVICGCPVFVHQDSAASLVGLTDMSKIEAPIYPERQPWLNSLAYSQWDERELTDGTLFRMLE